MKRILCETTLSYKQYQESSEGYAVEKAQKVGKMMSVISFLSSSLQYTHKYIHVYAKKRKSFGSIDRLHLVIETISKRVLFSWLLMHCEPCCVFVIEKAPQYVQRKNQGLDVQVPFCETVGFIYLFYMWGKVRQFLALN